jgi:hypothetical protein
MDTTFDEALVRVIRTVLKMDSIVDDMDEFHWNEVRSVIMTALRPFEEAQLAVSAALIALCA